MFNKKYIFETQRTFFLRQFKNASFYGFLIILFFVLVIFTFYLFSDFETRKSKSFFYQTRPDLMVVFTGDKGRIPYALELYKEFQFPKLFITGVYAKNTVNSLVKLYKQIDLDSKLIDIDYSAQNTVGNIISTLEVIKNTSYQKVLIITHDYHLLRSKFLLNKYNTNKKVDFYFWGIESDYSKLETLRKMTWEIIKFVHLNTWVAFTEGNKQE